MESTKRPLKIIFISFIGDLKHNTKGFVKKDLDKVDALSKIEGVECLGVTFSDEIEQDYYYLPNYIVKKLPKLKPRKYFYSFDVERSEVNNLDKFLSEQEFDVALFRYNIASYSLHKLVKKYKNKIIFEHNTFEYTEHAGQINLRRANLKFSLKPGYFIYYFEGKLWPLFCEWYFGKKVRQNALAATAVTNEIAVYQSKLVPGYKNRVITNGIKYNESLLIKPVKYDGTELRLFMLLGTGANWHGLDRLMNGLKEYNGPVKLRVDIIGYTYQGDIEYAEKNGLTDKIHFLPPMSGNELNTKLQEYHLSIGTLAVHRKDLKEATPLKVRESLMRGFPNVIAYMDTDFIEKSEINKFILQLPADETPINFKTIVEFANSVLSVPNYPEVISRLARPKIEYSVKAQQTVDYIKELLKLK